MRLYEDGFKDRYYESKFGVLPSETKFRHRVAYEYTIGLCWVLRYYYQVKSNLKLDLSLHEKKMQPASQAGPPRGGRRREHPVVCVVYRDVCELLFKLLASR